MHVAAREIESVESCPSVSCQRHIWFCLVISIQNLYKPGLSAFPKNSRQKQHNVCFHKGVEVLLEHVGLIYGVLELYTPVISPSRIQAKLP